MIRHENNHLMLDDKTYEFAKKLVQIFLPASASLYFGLSQIWGLPGGENVVGTIVIISTFLGVVIGLSSSNYTKSGAAYDGRMVVVHPEDGPSMFTLELDSDPEDLVNRDSISFRVGETSQIPEHVKSEMPKPPKLE